MISAERITKNNEPVDLSEGGERAWLDWWKAFVIIVVLLMLVGWN